MAEQRLDQYLYDTMTQAADLLGALDVGIPEVWELRHRIAVLHERFQLYNVGKDVSDQALGLFLHRLWRRLGQP